MKRVVAREGGPVVLSREMVESKGLEEVTTSFSDSAAVMGPARVEGCGGVAALLLPSAGVVVFCFLPSC
jgi:hypothetical protein